MVMESNGITKRFLTLKESVAYSGVCDRNLRFAIAKGELTALRPNGGKVYLDIKEIDAWMLASATKRTRQGAHGPDALKAWRERTAEEEA